MDVLIIESDKELAKRISAYVKTYFSPQKINIFIAHDLHTAVGYFALNNFNFKLMICAETVAKEDCGLDGNGVAFAKEFTETKSGISKLKVIILAEEIEGKSELGLHYARRDIKKPTFTLMSLQEVLTSCLPLLERA